MHKSKRKQSGGVEETVGGQEKEREEGGGEVEEGALCPVSVSTVAEGYFLMVVRQSAGARPMLG